MMAASSKPFPFLLHLGASHPVLFPELGWDADNTLVVAPSPAPSPEFVALFTSYPSLRRRLSDHGFSKVSGTPLFVHPHFSRILSSSDEDALYAARLAWREKRNARNRKQPAASSSGTRKRRRSVDDGSVDDLGFDVLAGDIQRLTQSTAVKKQKLLDLTHATASARSALAESNAILSQTAAQLSLISSILLSSSPVSPSAASSAASS